MRRNGTNQAPMSNRLRSMFKNASAKDKQLELDSMSEGLFSIIIVPHACLNRFWMATATGTTWMAIMTRLHAVAHLEKVFTGLEDVDSLAIAFRAMYTIEQRFLLSSSWNATAAEVADVSIGLTYCDEIQNICTSGEMTLAFRAAAVTMLSKHQYL